MKREKERNSLKRKCDDKYMHFKCQMLKVFQMNDGLKKLCKLIIFGCKSNLPQHLKDLTSTFTIIEGDVARSIMSQTNESDWNTATMLKPIAIILQQYYSKEYLHIKNTWQMSILYEMYFNVSILLLTASVNNATASSCLVIVLADWRIFPLMCDFAEINFPSKSFMPFILPAIEMLPEI